MVVTFGKALNCRQRSERFFSFLAQLFRVPEALTTTVFSGCHMFCVPETLTIFSLCSAVLWTRSAHNFLPLLSCLCTRSAHNFILLRSCFVYQKRSQFLPVLSCLVYQKRSQFSPSVFSCFVCQKLSQFSSSVFSCFVYQKQYGGFLVSQSGEAKCNLYTAQEGHTTLNLRKRKFPKLLWGMVLIFSVSPSFGNYKMSKECAFIFVKICIFLENCMLQWMIKKPDYLLIVMIISFRISLFFKK